MLRRNLTPARRKAIKRVLLARRYTATGLTAAVLNKCLRRAAGRCETCGGRLGDRRGVDWSAHHRRPRRMGGSSNDPAVNQPANVLIVCGSGTTGCHGRIESHRTRAYQAGWLLRSGEVPRDTPVRLHGGWRLLGDDGSAVEAPEVTA